MALSCFIFSFINIIYFSRITRQEAARSKERDAFTFALYIGRFILSQHQTLELSKRNTKHTIDLCQIRCFAMCMQKQKVHEK